MAVDGRALAELAELFAPYATLYAVGGFCRDKLLGVEPRDLDICSELTVERVKDILSGSVFAVSDKYPRLGTVAVHKDAFRAEYTTFRTDSYPASSGRHRPDGVEFTKDISKDASRRDFRCNAVYFDVLRGEYLDITGGGMEDIRTGTLTAADRPEKVFGEDGLRVLRMARFSAELGFTPAPETFAAAKANARGVLDVSRERVLEELDKIFVADTAYPSLGIADGHVRGLRMLDDLGLLNVILPEVGALKGLCQNPNYHIYDAFGHSVAAYACAPPRLRWAALLHDIGKKIAVDRGGNMHGHDVMGAEAAAERLAALGMPHGRAERICRLISCHMTDLKEDMSEGRLRRFLLRNADIAEDLIALKYADGYASRGTEPREMRLERLYNEMKTDGTPFSVGDLAADGRDAQAAGLSGRDIGEALSALLDEAVVCPALRTRERALRFLENYAQRIKRSRRDGADGGREKL